MGQIGAVFGTRYITFLNKYREKLDMQLHKSHTNDRQPLGHQPKAQYGYDVIL